MPVSILFLALVAVDTSFTVRVPVAEAETLSVTIRGHGAPVVFLPGLFGSSYAYRKVMAVLDSAGLQSIGIEPLGMGASSRPRDADYSLTAQADRVAVVLDSLRVPGAVVVGHSLGASIAMRLAYRHPPRVVGLVSLEGGPGETATTDGFRRWMRFAPVARMFDGRQMIQRMLYTEMREVSFDQSWVRPETVIAYTVGLASDYMATISAYQGMARSAEPERLRDHLSDIRCRVVLLVGETEHGSGPSDEEVRTLTLLLPAFSVDTVPQSGFFIQEEQPSAVAGAIRRVQDEGGCSA